MDRERLRCGRVHLPFVRQAAIPRSIQKEVTSHEFGPVACPSAARVTMHCYGVQLTETRKHAHPVVCTPVTGTVHLSHRVAAPPTIPDDTVVHDVGGVDESEYATVIVTPSVDPQFITLGTSGTYAVPTGTASVITNVNADADE